MKKTTNSDLLGRLALEPERLTERELRASIHALMQTETFLPHERARMAANFLERWALAHPRSKSRGIAWASRGRCRAVVIAGATS